VIDPTSVRTIVDCGAKTGLTAARAIILRYVAVYAIIQPSQDALVTPDSDDLPIPGRLRLRQ
jgi:hypothetical protein